MQSDDGVIAARPNKADGDALSRANGPEDVGRARPLMVQRRGACPALRPSSGDLVLRTGTLGSLSWPGRCPKADGVDGPRTATACQDRIDIRRPSAMQIATIGLDFAKHVFQ